MLQVRSTCIALFLFIMNLVGGNLPIIVAPLRGWYGEYRSHPVTCSPDNLATWPPGHLVTWSPGHLVTWSPGHLVTWPPGHLAT